MTGTENFTIEFFSPEKLFLIIMSIVLPINSWFGLPNFLCGLASVGCVQVMGSKKNQGQGTSEELFVQPLTLRMNIKNKTLVCHTQFR